VGERAAGIIAFITDSGRNREPADVKRDLLTKDEEQKRKSVGMGFI
jgi:hypothetical protein